MNMKKKHSSTRNKGLKNFPSKSQVLKQMQQEYEESLARDRFGGSEKLRYEATAREYEQEVMEDEGR